MSDWTYWQNALAGTFGDIPKGEIACGYYRMKSKAVAIWREDKQVFCLVDGRQQSGSEADIAERVFSWCSRSPITYESYTERMETGRWPEDPTADIEAAKADGPVPAEPHLAILAEIDATWKAFETWLASIGGKIASEEHDAKAEKFKDELLRLENKAQASFKAEKQPWLDGGRDVDNKWREAKEKPAALKKAVAKAAEPYRLERERLARAAEQKAAQEAQKARVEAAARNEPPPIQMSQPKRRTGLRSRSVVVLTDPRACIEYLAKLNSHPEDLLAAVRTVAGRMIEAGTQVPGAEIQKQQFAA